MVYRAIYQRIKRKRIAEVQLGSWCTVVSIFHALSQLSKACLTLLGSHSGVFMDKRLSEHEREGEWGR